MGNEASCFNTQHLDAKAVGGGGIGKGGSDIDAAVNIKKYKNFFIVVSFGCTFYAAILNYNMQLFNVGMFVL